MTRLACLTTSLLLGTLAASSAHAQSAEERIERSRNLILPERCRTSADPDEIVVCGAKRDNERYRLPIRDERSETSLYDRARGDVARASLDPPSSAPCGIFQGDRSCGKAESALFGYGRGRDPLTVGAKVVEQLANPD